MAAAESQTQLRPEIVSAAVRIALRRQKPWLIATLCIYALIEILFITATPFQSIELPDNLPQQSGAGQTLLVGIGPDEKEYLVYILSLANRGRLPAPSPAYRTSDNDYVSYQVQHPPLFFLLAAFLYKLTEPVIRLAGYWYLIRSLCALCGGLAVALVAVAAATAFPEVEFVVLAAPAAMAFLPMFAHICGNLSSEPFAMAIGAGAWLQMIRLARGERPATPRGAALLGVTIAFAALSRLTAVIYVPAALISLFCLPFGTSRTDDRPFGRLIGFAAALIVPIAPWFIRNRSLYGQWFPRPFDRPLLAGITIWQYVADVNQPLFIVGQPGPIVITPLRTALWYASTSWTPYWLIQFYLPGGLQAGPAWQAIGLLAIVFVALLLFLNASRSRREDKPTDRRSRTILWMAGVTVFVAVLGVLQQQFYSDWDAINSAGRYFVAAAPAGTLLLIFALSTRIQRRPRVAAAVFAAVILALDLYSALLVRQFYSDHPTQPAVQHVES